MGQRPQARLILMCGLPGSGKTTVAMELAEQLGAIRLSPDRWLEELELDGHDPAARSRVEGLQWSLAQDLLELGQRVILENGFWGRAERDTFRVRARELGAAVELRYLEVGTDELWRRLEARNADLPPHTFRVTRDQLSQWQSSLQPPDRVELELFDPPLSLST